MSRGSIASTVVVAVIGVLVLGYLGLMIFDDGESYSIEYDLDGGTLADSSINTYVSGKDTRLPVAYKDGSTFAGWFTDSGCTEPLGSITKDIRGDLKLYALWYDGSVVGKEYTLSGDGNVTYKVTEYADGVSTYSIVFRNSTIKYSDDDDKLTYIGNETVDGWNCAVWKYDDVTVYMYCMTPLKITKGAQSYTVGDIGCDITYNLNGGSLPDNADHKYIWGGEKMLVPAYRDGYYFDGWYTDSSYTQAKVVFTKDDSTYEVYAKWSDETPVGKQYDATIDGKTVSLKAYNYDHGKTYYVIEEGGKIADTFWTYSDKTESSASGSSVKWYVDDYTVSYGDTVKIQKGNTNVTASSGSFECSKPFVLVDVNLNVVESSSVEYGMPLSITLDSDADWTINSTKEKKRSISMAEFIPGTEITIFSDVVKKVGNSVTMSDLGLSGSIMIIDSDGNGKSISSSEYTFTEAGEYCFVETGNSYNHFIYVESGDIKTFEWSYNGNKYTLSLPMYESEVSKYKSEYPMKEIVDNKYSMKDHTRVYLYYEGNDTDKTYAEYIQRFFCEDKYVTQLVEELKDLYNKYNKDSSSRYDYANFVLHFVGTMKYVTDKESTEDMLYPGFGGFDEYYKFPAETLYDMCGDCEDYSILYAALMSASGYDTGVVTLPDHAMAIISLNGDFDGAKFEANGKTYYYCETTSEFNIGQLGTGSTSEVDKVDHHFYLGAASSTS